MLSVFSGLEINVVAAAIWLRCAIVVSVCVQRALIIAHHKENTE